MVVKFYKFKRIVGKPKFRDQFKLIIKGYEISGILHWYYAAVCMPGFQPNHGL